MNKQCKNKDFLIMNFRTLGGNCTLSFGYNSKFEFKILDNGMVSLSKRILT